MSKKLWQEVNGERHFLVPEGIPLEAGALEIESSSGDKMMVSEDSITAYLASEEEIEDFQNQTVEETIAELGKAFSSLFQAGKDIFTQALQATESSEEDVESEESENVIDVDFEEKNKESSEGFFSDINGIVQESKAEFQSIFQEAKQEFKKSLRDKETADLLKSIGNQILDFANSLQQEDPQTVEDSSEEDSSSVENDDGEDIEILDPPPVTNSDIIQSQNIDEDSNDIPPSPLSDDNE
ncbi:MAG: hypothetical protein CL916_08785 [Deltaproteobacteria bacterium]|nr:hypothetical protein [Deltaproteobacteria bacterium]